MRYNGQMEGDDLQQQFAKALRLYQQQQLSAANRLCRQILQCDRQYTAAMSLQGVICHQRGRFRFAEILFKIILQYTPDDPISLVNLGNLYTAKGDYAQALSQYQRAHQLEPNNSHYRYAIADLYRRQGQWQKSINVLVDLLALEPTHQQGLLALANGYQALDMLPQALDSYQQYCQYYPQDSTGHAQVAYVLQQQQAYAKAIDYCHQSLINFPQDLELLNILATCYQRHDQSDQSIPYWQQLVALTGDNVELHGCFAAALLKTGQYQRGWEEYEWRLQSKAFAFLQPIMDIPRWQGESLAGKTLRIHAEQGFGDTIQFLRYIPLLDKGNQTLIFEGPEALCELVASMPAIDQVISRGQVCPTADFYIPIASFAKVFHTTFETIPQHTPYLLVNEYKRQKWQQIINTDGYKIAFQWGGKPLPIDRGCAVNYFFNLAASFPATFYSFQLDDRKLQLRQQQAPDNIIDLSHDIDNFADSAAALQHMDLVISIDTALVHLAGALGKPVWDLTVFACDWRWQARSPKTPWYQSLTLFHQPRLGDWDSVFQKVYQELEKMVPRNETCG